MSKYQHSRVGIYVDASNIYYSRGAKYRFEVLRQVACRDGGEIMRLNAYSSYDESRAEEDHEYKMKAQEYFSRMRDHGFKVIIKPVRWYQDEMGDRHGKANADVDMAVDALQQSHKLDKVLLVTGDGDFVQLVRALQNRGCRVEVLAFDNVSKDLKQEVDMFISGFLVPKLLDSGRGPAWGDLRSRVRGLCYHYDNVKKFGFLSWPCCCSPTILSCRKDVARIHPDSPYSAAFMHSSRLEDHRHAHQCQHHGEYATQYLYGHEMQQPRPDISANRAANNHAQRRRPVQVTKASGRQAFHGMAQGHHGHHPGQGYGQATGGGYRDGLLQVHLAKHQERHTETAAAYAHQGGKETYAATGRQHDGKAWHPPHGVRHHAGSYLDGYQQLKGPEQPAQMFAGHAACQKGPRTRCL